MSLTVLVDLDDTLWDLVDAWTKMLNAFHNLSVKPDDITGWEISKYYPCLTAEQLYQPLSIPFFWDGVKPMQGALEAIRRLKDDGHIIRVVTATHISSMPYKIERFLERFPVLKWEDIVIARDKSMIVGDAMVDDGIHNLERTRAAVKLLYDRPHNRAYPAAENGMIRVRSWDEVYHTITEIAGR